MNMKEKSMPVGGCNNADIVVEELREESLKHHGICNIGYLCNNMNRIVKYLEFIKAQNLEFLSDFLSNLREGITSSTCL